MRDISLALGKPVRQTGVRGGAGHLKGEMMRNAKPGRAINSMK